MQNRKVLFISPSSSSFIQLEKGKCENQIQNYKSGKCIFVKNLFKLPVRTHIFLHSSSVSQRLSFPPQPPYQNCAQALACLSQYQRMLQSRQVPWSRLRLQRGSRIADAGGEIVCEMYILRRTFHYPMRVAAISQPILHTALKCHIKSCIQLKLRQSSTTILQ